MHLGKILIQREMKLERLVDGDERVGGDAPSRLHDAGAVVSHELRAVRETTFRQGRAGKPQVDEIRTPGVLRGKFPRRDDGHGEPTRILIRAIA